MEPKHVKKWLSHAIVYKVAAFAGCLALCMGSILAAQAQATPPGSNPEGIYQSPEEDKILIFTPGAAKENTVESTAKKGDKRSISGQVLFRRGGSFNQGVDSKARPIPMQGVRVYAQWVEKRGASPIYWSITDENGDFHIYMKSVKMANAKDLQFDANPMLGLREYVRVWAENPDNNTYSVLYNYTMGTLWPNVPFIDMSGKADWNAVTHKLQNVRIDFGETPQPQLMHLDKAAPTEAKQAGGFISGKVFWNLTRLISNLTWSGVNAKNDPSDIPADSTVTISYLSDYAVQRIYTDGAKAIGFDGKIRSLTKWNSIWEAKLQNWIKREMAKEGKEKWIAETVAVDTSPATGEYTAQFKGT